MNTTIGLFGIFPAPILFGLTKLVAQAGDRVCVLDVSGSDRLFEQLPKVGQGPDDYSIEWGGALFVNRRTAGLFDASKVVFIYYGDSSEQAYRSRLDVKLLFADGTRRGFDEMISSPLLFDIGCDMLIVDHYLGTGAQKHYAQMLRRCVRADTLVGIDCSKRTLSNMAKLDFLRSDAAFEAKGKIGNLIFEIGKLIYPFMNETDLKNAIKEGRKKHVDNRFLVTTREWKKQLNNVGHSLSYGT